MITAASDPVTASRSFLRRAQRTGAAVWLSYGQAEITGYVLDVDRVLATMQDRDTGEVREVALVAIDEATEV